MLFCKYPNTSVKDHSIFFSVATKTLDCCIIVVILKSWCRKRPIGRLEVAGWTLDRKIRVRFPAYPHRVWALWWQGGKRRLRTSRCRCRGRLGTLKTPSCPWRGCPAAGQNLDTGHLSRHYIAEISLNVTLNHNQQQQQLPFKRRIFPSRRNFISLQPLQTCLSERYISVYHFA